MRTILVVDDVRANREILKKILGEEYVTLEAGDGQEALNIMEREHRQLSAVLLDLNMPVLDGFEVLEQMRSSETLSKLPVIVTTGQTEAESEVKALRLGANDYISKPYSATIIRQRLRNTINLRETAAAVNEFQRDKLTGLYSRAAFLERAEEMIAAREPGYYILACFDVDNFKVLNDRYGTQKGDEVLRYIGQVFQEGFAPCGGICCRVTADNYAVLYPASFQDSAEIKDIRAKLTAAGGLVSPLTFSIGRYLVEDLSLSASTMYDRAILAEQTVKGRYDVHIAQYNETMRDRLIRDQQIVGEMDSALAQRQFEVWFQPQYNHATGALIGAEALVRWRHPQDGLIPPGEFIPVFERNGFIYELDKYVWEESCRFLRKWSDEGRAPLPVSVNVSRYDLFRDDLVEVLAGLPRRYGLSPELLRLEITESAFAESSQQIVAIVRRLIACGFLIEIDDFGSGYSSLNTLKNVPAQIVKLDMRFLEDDGGSQRGGNILESVVRMTKWLGMSVVAEGVETRAQADFLKSIGCSYVQGYLYARPMPAADYEALLRDSPQERRLSALETVENLDNNAFWDPKSMDTLIFNTYVGGACIFEYHDGRIELLRATDRYVRMLLGENATVEDVLRLDFAAHLAPGGEREILRSMEESLRTKDEVTSEYLFLDFPGCPQETWLRSSIRVIAHAGVRYLVYCISDNITAQRRAERAERETARQLQTVLDNVNCGITAVVIRGERVEYLLTNDRYYDLLGYTRAQYHAEVGERAFTTIHPEDRPRMADAVARVVRSGEAAGLEYRALRRDGRTVWLRSSISMTTFEGVAEPVQLSTYTDVTAEKMAAQELLDNLPCGAGLYDYRDGDLTIGHLNRRFKEMVGREADESGRGSALENVHPDDLPMLRAGLRTAMEGRGDLTCELRIRSGAGDYQYFTLNGRGVRRDDGSWAVYTTFMPITEEAVSIREMLPIALEAMMSSQNEFTFVKDRNLRYVCCSRAFARLVGLDSEGDVAGKTDFDIFEPALARRYRADDRRLLESGTSLVDYTEDLPSPDGTAHYANTSKYLLHDSRGNVVGLYGVSRDITEAREADSQLKLLTDSIPGGLATYECGPEGVRLTYFNQGFCRLFGCAYEDYARLSAQDPLVGVAKEDVPVLLAQLERLKKENIPIDHIYTAYPLDGGSRRLSLKALASDRRGEAMTVNAVLFDVTEQQEALERLRVSEEENRLAAAHSGSTVCRYSVAERTLSVPRKQNSIFHLPARLEDVPGGPVRRGEISPETAGAYRAFYDDIRAGKESGAAVYQRKSDKGWRWLEAHFSTVFSDAGEPTSAVISFTDVTEQIEKEAIYKKWQQSLREKPPETYTLFRSNLSRNTSYDTVEGRLLTVAFTEGPQSFDQRTEEFVEKCVYEEDRDRYTAFLDADSLLAAYYRGKRAGTLEFREKLPEGGVRWLRLTVELVEYPNSTDVEAYMMYENIDDSKRAELLTIERAETDPLTGVLNRAAFVAKFEQRVAQLKPHTQCALLMLDIDGFKMVNDAFGHGAGDQALVDIAESLRSALRRDDLLGRLGGDEFLIFLSDIPGDTVAANKARQICALTRKSFSMEVEITGSVGIALYPKDGGSFDELYKKADAALYHVKGAGKDHHAFYHDEMEDQHLTPEKRPAALGETRRQGKKRRMLIVDDNQIDYALTANVFAEDFLIEKARDGEAALIRLRHYGPAISVVLLDLMMPGMDGFEVLEKMRQTAELRTIPVVVVSGDEEREVGLRAIRAGASDFVTKPFDPDLLRVRVHSAISKVENERLRAKNSFLEYQSAEALRYRTVLERSGIAVVEYDWVAGTFLYDPAISEHLAGVYDDRTLWHILLSDLVAVSSTVQALQEAVRAVAEDRKARDGRLEVRLKAPDKTFHRFRVSIFKLTDAYGLTGKLLLSFYDVGRDEE